MVRRVFCKVFAIGLLTWFFTTSAYASDPVLCRPQGNVSALIMCILNANSFGGGTIDLGGYVYTLTESYTGTGAAPSGDGPTGLPDIVSIITIKDGTITTNITPSTPSSDTFRHLHVSPPGVLNLTNVTLENGSASAGFFGGSIYVVDTGILGTIKDCQFIGNFAFSGGGAIAILNNSSTNSINNEIIGSIFSDNNSGHGFGGAIYLQDESGSSTAALRSITDSVFINNSSSVQGGAICMNGNAAVETLTKTAFIANTSGGGGGGAIFFARSAPLVVDRIDSCTFSFNQAAGGGNGGAIYSNFVINQISNSTFNNNFSDGGGTLFLGVGPYNEIFNNTFTQNSTAAFTIGAALTFAGCHVNYFVNNTIVSNISGFDGAVFNDGGHINVMESNIVAANFSTQTTPPSAIDFTNTGTINFPSFNLIGSNDTSTSTFVNGVDGNIVGTLTNPINPNVDVLRNNGGPTFTMALLSNSPAIGVGANPLGLSHDQRGVGFARTIRGLTDMGAFQVQSRDH